MLSKLSNILFSLFLTTPLIICIIFIVLFNLKTFGKKSWKYKNKLVSKAMKIVVPYLSVTMILGVFENIWFIWTNNKIEIINDIVFIMIMMFFILGTIVGIYYYAKFLMNDN